MKPLSLELEEILLRPLTMADAPEIARICQDPLIQKWTTIPSPYSIDDAETYVTLSHRWWDHDQPTWLIDVDGAIAGTISFNTPLAKGKRTEIGFWANPEHRGKGYMTDAVRGVCHWAFRYGVGAIGWAAEIHDGNLNHGSIRVAQKAGFVYDGRRRLALHNKGELVDAIYATLAPSDPIIDTAPWPHTRVSDGIAVQQC
ncbi:MAG: GNAT family N-acetyltransferase [Actinomycetaceae bacterium]|nr:GNAT family N-acetyltransferase [Arcanobacterium sp.]MDD7504607.1 GNAT family N-acetyltransferase [Actinomycetaceae bacterium]MDY6143077.1 GNAT family N-acetyltransferase [Arcanobacterium sp.]